MVIFTQCHAHPEPFSIRQLVCVIGLTTCPDAAEKEDLAENQPEDQAAVVVNKI